ncbi:MAG: hypothetical protein ABS68_09805 [Niastella sp. SCN 39-18]|nr:MAG: hypothetical protein ABS68_09805 [Niastella sp. SCN 39-18]
MGKLNYIQRLKHYKYQIFILLKTYPTVGIYAIVVGLCVHFLIRFPFFEWRIKAVSRRGDYVKQAMSIFINFFYLLNNLQISLTFFATLLIR